jgi:hypothetical protein
VDKLDQLWGATITHMELDLPRHTLKLGFKLVEGHRAQTHPVLFEGVTELRFLSEIEYPWNYAEATEIHCSRGADGSITTEIVLWNEPSGLHIRCDEVNVDGQPIPIGNE